jgi:hypothetical protein
MPHNFLPNQRHNFWPANNNMVNGTRLQVGTLAQTIKNFCPLTYQFFLTEQYYDEDSDVTDYDNVEDNNIEWISDDDDVINGGGGVKRPLKAELKEELTIEETVSVDVVETAPPATVQYNNSKYFKKKKVVIQNVESTGTFG